MLSPWLQTHAPNPSAELRLICFPFAGGSAQAYKEWQVHLPRSVEVCAVQLPGREMRQRETPIDSASGIVEALLPALEPILDRPFVLFGHSMGALVAFELAAQLERGNYRVPERLVVSGRVAPHRELARPPINKLPREDFVAGLRALNGTPTEVLDDSGLMDLIEPMLRADLAVHENYIHADKATVRADILAFGGLADPEAPRHGVAAWAEVTDGSFSMQMMPGDHFFIRSSQSLFLRSLSIELRRVMTRLRNLESRVG